MPAFVNQFRQRETEKLRSMRLLIWTSYLFISRSVHRLTLILFMKDI